MGNDRGPHRERVVKLQTRMAPDRKTGMVQKGTTRRWITRPLLFCRLQGTACHLRPRQRRRRNHRNRITTLNPSRPPFLAPSLPSPLAIKLKEPDHRPSPLPRRNRQVPLQPFRPLRRLPNPTRKVHQLPRHPPSPEDRSALEQQQK